MLRDKPVLTALVVVLILINVYLASGDILSFGKGILVDINKAGVWRGARFAVSENFADYILFLRGQIPENGRVILPPKGVANWALSSTPHMQFFLSPREIINCTTLDCGRYFLDQENTYVLIMGKETFPGDEIRGRYQHIRMHNDTWGIYGPSDGFDAGDDPQHLSPGGNFLINMILPLVSMLTLLTAGLLVTRSLSGEGSIWSNVGLGYGMISGVLSVVVYLVLLVFPALPLGPLLFTFLGLMTLLGLLAWRLKGKPGGESRDGQQRAPLSIWVLGILILGILYSFLAVGAGYHTTDAIVLWGAKGKGIVHEGLLGVPGWGTNSTNYPLHIPLLIAVFEAAFSGSLPASKLLFPLYYLSLLLVMFEFLSRKMKEDHAGLVTLAFGLSPILVRHARIGYANLALSYYVLCGVLLLYRTVGANEQSESFKYRLLSSAFFLFAVWTRPEGILLIAGILGAFVLEAYLSSQRKPPSLSALVSFLPAVLFWGFWKLTSTPFQVQGGTGLMVQEFLGAVKDGKLQLGSLGRVVVFFLQQLANINSWASLGCAWLAAGALGLWGGFPKRWRPSLLGLAGLTNVTAIIGMYYIFAFDPVHDIDWWLGSGFNRMVLPGMGLLWIAAMMRVWDDPR